MFQSKLNHTIKCLSSIKRYQRNLNVSATVLLACKVIIWGQMEEDHLIEPLWLFLFKCLDTSPGRVICQRIKWRVSTTVHGDNVRTQRGCARVLQAERSLEAPPDHPPAVHSPCQCTLQRSPRVCSLGLCSPMRVSILHYLFKRTNRSMWRNVGTEP